MTVVCVAQSNNAAPAAKTSANPVAGSSPRKPGSGDARNEAELALAKLGETDFGGTLELRHAQSSGDERAPHSSRSKLEQESPPAQPSAYAVGLPLPVCDAPEASVPRTHPRILTDQPLRPAREAWTLHAKHPSDAIPLLDWKPNEASAANATGQAFLAGMLAAITGISAETHFAPPAEDGSDRARTAALADARAAGQAAAAHRPEILKVLKIQLHPADLGTVNVALRLRGARLELQIEVGQASAWGHLSASRDALLKVIREAGYSSQPEAVQIVLRPCKPAETPSAQLGSQSPIGEQHQGPGSGASEHSPQPSSSSGDTYVDRQPPYC